MKNTYYIIFTLSIFLFLGCKQKDIERLEIKQVHIESLSFGANNHSLKSYHHVLILKDYDGRDGWSHDFIDFADRYRDTLTDFIPASEITICKPFELERGSLDNNFSLVQKNAILSISYTNETLDRRYPDIWGIMFYNKGESFYVDLSTKERRKQSDSYSHYDSSGNYTYDWIDTINNHISINKGKGIR